MPVRLGKSVYVAESAVIIGDVTLGDGVSVYDNTIIRGDMDTITIGENTNIQDNCTIHVDDGYPTTIGKGVSVGHNAVIHGARIGNYVVVGMGAIVMNGATIGDGSVIGAGSVVTQNFRSEEESLILGVPARVVKKDSGYREYAVKNYKEYVKLREGYLSGRIERRTGRSFRP